jgi:hypothetical protein
VLTRDVTELYWKQEQSEGTRHTSNTVEQELKEAEEEQEASSERDQSNESDEGGGDIADDAHLATTEEDTSYETSQL